MVWHSVVFSSTAQRTSLCFPRPSLTLFPDRNFASQRHTYIYQVLLSIFVRNRMSSTHGGLPGNESNPRSQQDVFAWWYCRQEPDDDDDVVRRTGKKFKTMIDKFFDEPSPQVQASMAGYIDHPSISSLSCAALRGVQSCLTDVVASPNCHKHGTCPTGPEERCCHAQVLVTDWVGSHSHYGETSIVTFNGTITDVIASFTSQGGAVYWLSMSYSLMKDNNPYVNIECV